MGRVRHSGFEFSTYNEPGGAFYDWHGKTGTVTKDTGVFRSGLASVKFDSAAGNVAATLEFDDPQGVTTNEDYYFRFYLRFGALPASTVRVMRFGTATGGDNQVSARLTSAGKLQLWNDTAGTQIGSDSAATIAIDTWYRVEMFVDIDGSSQMVGTALRLDGIEVASGSFAALFVGAQFMAGWIDAPGASKVMYADDFAANDSSGAVNNSWPGEGRVVRLLPVSDSQRGSWTGGAGGTTNLWDAVNNVPPIGTASETNLTQIESTDSSGDNATDEYRAAMTTPTDAGVPAGATINALSAYIWHGEDVNTGTKTGSFGWHTPSTAYSTFTFGNNLGALGTWPAVEWVAETPSAQTLDQPSLALGSNPIMAVRKTDTGTRVASVCAMYAYLDYTEAAVVANVPRHGFVNHANPGVLMKGIRRAWHRRSSGIFVPEYSF